MNNIKITITGTEPCPYCHGSGLEWPSVAAEDSGDESRMVTCHNCGGNGELTDSQDITLPEFRALMDATMEEEE